VDSTKGRSETEEGIALETKSENNLDNEEFEREESSQSGFDTKDNSSQEQNILRELAKIQNILERRLSHDRVKDEAFERLYQDLDHVKRNRALEELRPLFIDLILFYDRIQTVDIDSGTSINEILCSLKEELEEILLRREIEPIKSPIDFFNPKFHKAVGLEQVESVELDGKIIRVLRDGFIYRETVLRPQEVVVGRYKPKHEILKEGLSITTRKE